MLALWLEGLAVGKEAEDAEGHDHVPDRVDDVVVLLGLEEGVADEADHDEDAADGKVEGKVASRGEAFLGFATPQAPADGDQADAGEGRGEEYPEGLLVEFGAEG